MIIGIDYSMTTPAITVREYTTTCNFLTSVKKYQTSYLPQSNRDFTIVGWPYPEFTSQEDRFNGISDWAMKLCKKEDTIVIEDYAMGAKGKVFHIAENCGLLKHKLYKQGIKFVTIAPTALKKFATGKGNADKCAMYDAFVNETGIHLRELMESDNKDCGSPVSDIVDSYFLALYGETIKH